jgi:hypothetical protein
MEKVVMNLCFLMGKINSEINFNFILNSKNISVSSFKLKVGKDTKVLVKAYNDMADWCYQNLARKDIVLIQGELNSNLEIIITSIESKIPLAKSKK